MARTAICNLILGKSSYLIFTTYRSCSLRNCFVALTLLPVLSTPTFGAKSLLAVDLLLLREKSGGEAWNPGLDFWLQNPCHIAERCSAFWFSCSFPQGLSKAKESNSLLKQKLSSALTVRQSDWPWLSFSSFGLVLYFQHRCEHNTCIFVTDYLISWLDLCLLLQEVLHPKSMAISGQWPVEQLRGSELHHQGLGLEFHIPGHRRSLELQKPSVFCWIWKPRRKPGLFVDMWSDLNILDVSV